MEVLLTPPCPGKTHNAAPAEYVGWGGVGYALGAQIPQRALDAGDRPRFPTDLVLTLSVASGLARSERYSHYKTSADRKVRCASRLSWPAALPHRYPHRYRTDEGRSHCPPPRHSSLVYGDSSVSGR